MKPEKKPQKADFEASKIQEGNKTYYRLAGLIFSQAAFDNLHQLKTAKGLRIKVDRGGCSGFKYAYDFFDKPQEEENVFPLSEDLHIFMDDFTFSKLHGSSIDFTLGLHGAGLKIINPNVKNSCSCGVSVGF